MLVLAVGAMAYATPYYGWQSEESVTTGTVGLWQWNASSGHAISSVSGGLRLYKNGAVNYGTGKFGNGAVCPGGINSGDDWQIEYSSGAGYNMDAIGADPSLSVAIWVDPSALPTTIGQRSVIFDKCASNNPTAGYNLYLYYDTDNKVYLKAEIGTKAGTSVKASVVSDLVVGQWSHLALVWDAATDALKIYENGSVITSTTSAGSIYAPSIGGSTNAQLLRVGQRLCANYGAFNGTLDDLKVSNIAIDYAIPEPTTIVILGMGAITAVLRRRK
jgi:hypothetical protein